MRSAQRRERWLAGFVALAVIVAVSAVACSDAPFTPPGAQQASSATFKSAMARWSGGYHNDAVRYILRDVRLTRPTLNDAEAICRFTFASLARYHAQLPRGSEVPDLRAVRDLARSDCSGLRGDGQGRGAQHAIYFDEYEQSQLSARAEQLIYQALSVLESEPTLADVHAAMTSIDWSAAYELGPAEAPLVQAVAGVGDSSTTFWDYNFEPEFTAYQEAVNSGGTWTPGGGGSGEGATANSRTPLSPEAAAPRFSSHWRSSGRRVGYADAQGAARYIFGAITSGKWDPKQLAIGAAGAAVVSSVGAAVDEFKRRLN